MRTVVTLLLVALVVLAPVSVLATEPHELNDAILFFVNDPQEITFCDMNLLVDRNRMYQLERKNLDEAQVQNFFEHMQTHGIIDAGTGANKCEVGYVVQNNGTEVNGVLAIKGKYDKEKLLGYFRNHYTEHSNEHAGQTSQQKFSGLHGEKATNPYVEVQQSMQGQQAHIFPMPLANRELIVVSSPDVVYISSARRGQRNLLQRTMDVLTGRLPRKPAPKSVKVVMNFAPTGEEKQQIEQRVWARYDEQRKDSVSKKKYLKKAGERFRQRIIRGKVKFIMEAMQEMEVSTFTVYRGSDGDMTKIAILESTFADTDRAQDVKKRVMKHMIKEIKRNDNVQDKFALGKVSITTQGPKVLVRVDLQDSKEQLHAFNLISGYITTGFVERAQEQN